MSHDRNDIQGYLRRAMGVQEALEAEKYVPPKPKPQEELEEELPTRPIKKKFVPSNPAGRGKGNIAKATVNRTVAFRSALDDEDWEDIAITTFNRMMDPKCKNGDFVKLAMFLARYNLVSADAQLVIDSENGSLTGDQIDMLRAYLKGDGMPSALNKHSLVP